MTRNPRVILPAAVVAVAILLAACRGAGSGGAYDPSGPDAASAVSASATASSAPSSGGEPSASSSDSVGAFACDFPVTGDATVNRAHLVNVRVGEHAGYDRVVFEFEHGVPGFSLKRAAPPLLEDASGRVMHVDGDAFWQLVMRGASRTDLNGQTSFTDTDSHPDFPKLTELVEGGDFEAVSTWYFGLDGESCVRQLTLKDPSRLVFDIQH